MAWPGQLKAEDILGMTTDEFKAKLDASPSKQDLEALKTENGEIKSQLTLVLEALKASKTPAPEPVRVEDPEDPLVSNLTDPEAFLNKRMAPVTAQLAETQAQMMEMRARQSQQFAGVFAQYGDELVQLAAKMPAATRATPNFWEWHIRTVLGDKFVKGELKTSSYPTLIGSSSVGVDPTGGKINDPNKGFNPEVANFLKDRNVPLDKAAKLQQLMSDGEPITLEKYKGAASA